MSRVEPVLRPCSEAEIHHVWCLGRRSFTWGHVHHMSTTCSAEVRVYSYYSKGQEKHQTDCCTRRECIEFGLIRMHVHLTLFFHTHELQKFTISYSRIKEKAVCPCTYYYSSWVPPSLLSTAPQVSSPSPPTGCLTQSMKYIEKLSLPLSVFFFSLHTVL